MLYVRTSLAGRLLLVGLVTLATNTSSALHAQTRGGLGGGAAGGSGGSVFNAGSTGGSVFNTGSTSGGAFGTGGLGGASFMGTSFGGGFGQTGFGTGSFTGGTFQGGMAFQGGGAGLGGGFGGGLGGQNATSVGIQPLGNPFAASYANPLALGLPNGSQALRFGTALYATIINPQTAAQGRSTVSRVGGTSGGFGGSGFGGALGSSTMNSAGQQAPRFQTTIGFPSVYSRNPVSNPGPIVARELPTLTAVLTRSTALRGGRDFRVLQEGETVVLRGAVETESERRLAESLIWLSPGVREVRNEIVVSTAASPASRGP